MLKGGTWIGRLACFCSLLLDAFWNKNWGIMWTHSKSTLLHALRTVGGVANNLNDASHLPDLAESFLILYFTSCELTEGLPRRCTRQWLLFQGTGQTCEVENKGLWLWRCLWERTIVGLIALVFGSFNFFFEQKNIWTNGMDFVLVLLSIFLLSHRCTTVLYCHTQRLTGLFLSDTQFSRVYSFLNSIQINHFFTHYLFN